ncbi:hypothetical protein SAMN05192574_10991 [Mucilaginibacter gossypiicola]|uniref:Uncharacterized protein n=1 Tax=Mucilaginibacter gossypiicola TaxID=551995 RepID=A0A1H8QPW9_9SPHI|nr:hypothetical protein [Mucilaginibacter gossypiicola]SEO56096.1 hypothetical protein SAMN05192574_10991 [Mucilaginibacter gossypiicola]
MYPKDLIGKRITDIYCLVKIGQYELDFASCFIELEGGVFVSIPYDFNDEVRIETPDPGAKSIFLHPSIKIEHVNPGKKSIAELAYNNYTGWKRLIVKIRHIFAYRPYKTEFAENKLMNIKGRGIVDLLSSGFEDEKLIVELDNGYFITETTLAPSGLGLAGINYFTCLADLLDGEEDDLMRLSTTWASL